MPSVASVAAMAGVYKALHPQGLPVTSATPALCPLASYPKQAIRFEGLQFTAPMEQKYPPVHNPTLTPDL